MCTCAATHTRMHTHVHQHRPESTEGGGWGGGVGTPQTFRGGPMGGYNAAEDEERVFSSMLGCRLSRRLALCSLRHPDVTCPGAGTARGPWGRGRRALP